MLKYWFLYRETFRQSLELHSLISCIFCLSFSPLTLLLDLRLRPKHTCSFDPFKQQAIILSESGYGNSSSTNRDAVFLDIQNMGLWAAYFLFKSCHFSLYLCRWCWWRVFMMLMQAQINCYLKRCPTGEWKGVAPVLLIVHFLLLLLLVLLFLMLYSPEEDSPGINIRLF